MGVLSATSDVLDRSKPYGEIYGEPGVAFEQNGKYYDGGGSLVVPKGATDVPAVETPEPVAVVAAPVTADVPTPTSNKVLRAQMEQYGQEWTSREAALRFLGIQS